MRFHALAIACVAAIGCGEDQTVNGVFPSSAFLGRTVRVEISGDNTSFDSDTRVDFGPDITVSSLSVASPTAIFAEIVVADTAAPGLRDVIVSGDDTLTLSNAFRLTSPVVVDFQGTLAQGSVVEFTVHNFDFFAPFDDTCTASSLFGCDEYGNVTVVSPPGTNVLVGFVSPYMLSGTMLVDVDAAAGPFSIASGAAEDTPVISPLGENVDITARTATALSGMTTATIAAPFESHLYEVDAAANSVIRFSGSSDNAPPTLYLLPESGHFADLLGGGSRPTYLSQTAGKLYVVAVDGTGESGFAYTLRANPLALTPVAEADASGANDTAGTAQNTTTNSTILVTGGTLSSETDEDWYRFTVPANSSGKSVRVLTTGGDPATDTFVEIYADKAGDPPVPGTQIGESADSSYHENTTSMMTVGDATTIYVRILWSPDYQEFYDGSNTKYLAAIWLE